MAKLRSSEARLARLRQLRGEATSPLLLEELRRALRDPSNLVVAEAAEIAGKARLADLAPDLVAAFERFLDNPVKKDKLCRAKTALVDALNQIDFTDEAFYLRGLRYVQPEPVWGGTQDAAVPIRVACAFGLVRNRARGVLPLLVDLLVDPEKGARAGAAQALAYSGTEAAALVLRLKARLGDADPEVISECFTGLLQLVPEQAVSFVAEFLADDDAAIQEAAVLALGSARRPEAFEVLKTFAETHSDDLHEVACVALALLRLPAATEFLLQRVTDPSEAVALAAISALAVHRYDSRVRERVAEAVSAPGRAALRALFEKRFRTED